VETEWYHLPERGEALVNVTDLYDTGLRKVLAEVGEELDWTGVEYTTVTDPDGSVSEWEILLGATMKESV
jgi:hypothetical protein